jgi:hypothetical protein
VEVQDLPGRGGERLPPFDPENAGVAPHRAHEALGSGAGADGGKERRGDAGRVDRPDGRMHEEPHDGFSGDRFLLD